MTAHFTGGCACGAIRYQIAAEPVATFHCQCRSCQKATGTGHASAMVFPRAAATVTGQPRFYESPADSGNLARRGFCPSCGSLVLGGTSGVPEMLAVFAGSLDEPARFVPQAVIYHSRAQAWDHVDAALPRFAQMPPPPAGAAS